MNNKEHNTGYGFSIRSPQSFIARSEKIDESPDAAYIEIYYLDGSDWVLNFYNEGGTAIYILDDGENNNLHLYPEYYYRKRNAIAAASKYLMKVSDYPHLKKIKVFGKDGNLQRTIQQVDAWRSAGLNSKAN